MPDFIEINHKTYNNNKTKNHKYMSCNIGRHIIYSTDHKIENYKCTICNVIWSDHLEQDCPERCNACISYRKTINGKCILCNTIGC